MSRPLTSAFLITMVTGLNPASAQVPPTPQAPAAATPAAPGGRGAGRGGRQSPTRDPHTPGYVKAKELPDGDSPSPKADGNFIIGPTHPPRRR